MRYVPQSALTRIALKPYLGGKPLKSRELFRQFMPARAAAGSR